MSLSEGTGGSSSPESVALGEVLAFFGAVADYAAGAAPGESERAAAVAAGIAKIAGLPQSDVDALYFAALLRNAGAIANAAFAKGEPLSERERAMVAWDVPAESARICGRIASLPEGVADTVRWQAECWDGTGYPDQLRWSGIPKIAQLLHIALAYASIADPEEALSEISMGSGRAFAPAHTSEFVTWFHTFGGDAEPIAAPYYALHANRTSPEDLIALLSERVDAHNGTPGRAQRVARRTSDLAAQLGCNDAAQRQAGLAATLFGIGELGSPNLESAQFDALARLGIETRAKHAVAAANLVEQCGYLSDVAPVLRARAEWYDGSGAPDGLRHGAIPRAAQLLAVAIAYDAIDEAYRSRITEERTLPIVRVETVSGTQFDPAVVRALSEVVRARA